MFEDENNFDVLLVKISLFVILFEKLILCQLLGMYSIVYLKKQ